MRRILNTILVIILLLTVVSVAFHPIPTQAGAVDITCLFNPGLCVKEFSFGSVFKGIVAYVGELVLSASAWFLSVSGMVLNIAIVLTLNIKALYEATPAIDQIWLVIRNLSSMFIIFALIYTSILTILDAAKTSASTLIKNIIMAGILINFSLFFTKTLIDASNLVSLQFYRALVPNSATIDKNSISSILGSATPTAENGLSNIFMQNLKLPSLYNNPKGFVTGVAETDFFHIIIATVGGSILILLAAGSILAAAIAFIIRIVILLLLMGFSPVYFVGMIFPQIESNISGKWRSLLIGQLIFMPVYLLLMYVSVRFLTGVDGMGFFSQLDAARTASSKNNFMMATVGLVLQYTIAYFVMLAPLIAALKLGGDSAKWGSTAQKWVSSKLWGGGNAIGGAIGRNSAGRIARGLGKGFDSMAANAQSSELGRRTSSVLRNIGISQAVRGKLNQYENSKFGSKQSLADVEKEDKARNRVIGGVQRVQKLNSTLVNVIETPKQASDDDIKTISSMDVKDLEKIDIKTLKDPKVITAIPLGKFESLIKSDEFSIDEQSALKKAREDGYKEILKNNDARYLIEKLLKGKPADIAKLPGDILTDPDVATQLDPAALKSMIRENVGVKTRQTIRTNINNAFNNTAAPPPAAGSPLDKSYRYLQNNFEF